jgi:hypothetical protein
VTRSNPARAGSWRGVRRSAALTVVDPRPWGASLCAVRTDRLHDPMLDATHFPVSGREPLRRPHGRPQLRQGRSGLTSCPLRAQTPRNRGMERRCAKYLNGPRSRFPNFPATRRHTPPERLISLVMKGSPVRIRASASLNRAASRTEQARLRALESSVDRIWTAFGQRRARSQSPWKTEKSNPNAPVAKQTITSAPTQRPTNGPTPIVGAMSK